MFKKLSMLGLCGVSLLGLTGCSLLMVEPNTEAVSDVEDGISVEISDGTVEIEGVGYFVDENSLGLRPEVLLEALNRLNPELGLNEIEFYQYENDSAIYIGSPKEKVMISYYVFNESMKGQLKDENSVGLLQSVMIHYDHTDEEAILYAENFLSTLNEIVLHEKLDDEVSDVAKGFSDFQISYYTATGEEVEYTLGEMSEQLNKKVLELSKMSEAKGLASIYIN